jgi:hypothetical protein
LLLLWCDDRKAPYDIRKNRYPGCLQICHDALNAIAGSVRNRLVAKDEKDLLTAGKAGIENTSGGQQAGEYVDIQAGGIRVIWLLRHKTVQDFTDSCPLIDATCEIAAPQLRGRLQGGSSVTVANDREPKSTLQNRW